MGMYTEFHFNSELREDVPEDVLVVLRFMLGRSGYPKELPSHELFSSSRWSHMLRSDSPYFDADACSTLRFDHLTNSYYLCVRCSLKDYDNEISSFVDWITPYLEKSDGDFLGFSRYAQVQEPAVFYYRR